MMQNFRRILLLTGACLFFYSCTYDKMQLATPVTPVAAEFEKHFGGSSNEEGRAIIGSSDGNYIITGITDSYGSGGDDFYVVKTDQSGTKIWEKSFGGANMDWAHDIIETSDGNYLIAGESKSISFNLGFEAYFIKIDKDGNLIWEKN